MAAYCCQSLWGCGVWASVVAISVRRTVFRCRSVLLTYLLLGVGPTPSSQTKRTSFRKTAGNRNHQPRILQFPVFLTGWPSGHPSACLPACLPVWASACSCLLFFPFSLSVYRLPSRFNLVGPFILPCPFSLTHSISCDPLRPIPLTYSLANTPFND